MNDSTNTQTPRTDSAEQRDITGLGVVPVDFARKLERDLARVTAERDEAKAQRAELAACLIFAENESAALRARVADLQQQLDNLTASVNTNGK